MVGEKVCDAYWPDRLYNHDGCDPDGMVVLGKTPHGELVEMNSRAAESDLVIYVNLNFVPMDGGHKSMAVGLCGYESLKAHHTPQGDRRVELVHGSAEVVRWRTRSSASGRPVRRSTLKVFHIETVLNNRMFDGPLSFLMKNEDDFTETDRLKFQAMKWTLDKLPSRARREIFMRMPAAYELIAVLRRREPSRRTTRRSRSSYEQYCVAVDGPGRHPHHRASRTSRRTTSTPRRSTRCSCR